VITNPDILIDLKKDWEKFKASLDKPALGDENKQRLEFCQNYLRISIEQQKIKSISKELINAAMEKKESSDIGSVLFQHLIVKLFLVSPQGKSLLYDTLRDLGLDQMKAIPDNEAYQLMKKLLMADSISIL
jgi:hypothetical protein